jgi:exopolyphosphatase/guanosine-5'-triphosphate,3'-diphosphate pyrophosphatase
MAEIIPRWEWRSFGRRFGGAESRLAALTAGGVQESDEIYLLSGAGDNVKVRDGLMDIKVLRDWSSSRPIANPTARAAYRRNGSRVRRPPR